MVLKQTQLKFIPIIICSCAYLLCTPLLAFAASQQISWDAPTINADGTPLTDLGSYRVSIGTTSGIYTRQINTAATVTSIIVPDLLLDQNYYLIVQAIDTSGHQSNASNELMLRLSSNGDGNPGDGSGDDDLDAPTLVTPADFDGDGVSDPYSSTLLSDGSYIHKIKLSELDTTVELQFGKRGDYFHTADYNGDGRSELVATTSKKRAKIYKVLDVIDGQDFEASFPAKAKDIVVANCVSIEDPVSSFALLSARGKLKLALVSDLNSNGTLIFDQISLNLRGAKIISATCEGSNILIINDRSIGTAKSRRYIDVYSLQSGEKIASRRAPSAVAAFSGKFLGDDSRSIGYLTPKRLVIGYGRDKQKVKLGRYFNWTPAHIASGDSTIEGLHIMKKESVEAVYFDDLSIITSF